VVPHGKPGHEHPIDVALEQSGSAPPPDQFRLLDYVGFQRLRTLITAPEHKIELKVTELLHCVWPLCTDGRASQTFGRES
jgi:hypothetical protein